MSTFAEFMCDMLEAPETVQEVISPQEMARILCVATRHFARYFPEASPSAAQSLRFRPVRPAEDLDAMIEGCIEEGWRSRKQDPMAEPDTLTNDAAAWIPARPIPQLDALIAYLKPKFAELANRPTQQFTRNQVLRMTSLAAGVLSYNLSDHMGEGVELDPKHIEGLLKSAASYVAPSTERAHSR